LKKRLIDWATVAQIARGTPRRHFKKAADVVGPHHAIVEISRSFDDENAINISEHVAFLTDLQRM